MIAKCSHPLQHFFLMCKYNFDQSEKFFSPVFVYYKEEKNKTKLNNNENELNIAVALQMVATDCVACAQKYCKV